MADDNKEPVTTQEEDATKTDAKPNEQAPKTQAGTEDDPIINSTKKAGVHDARTKAEPEAEANEADKDVEGKVRDLEAKIKAFEVERQVHSESKRTGVSEDLLSATGLSGKALETYADNLKAALDSAGKATSADASKRISAVINSAASAPKRDGWSDLARQIRERFN